MNRGWVRIYRKCIDNDIFRFDPTAWHIFEYILLRADKETGEMKSAYSTISECLKIPKSTLHKAISRLKKAKMVNDMVNDNYTVFSIVNWHKYQDNGERYGERKVNAKGTQSEHIQEERIKNKEYISKDIDKSEYGDKNINSLFKVFTSKGITITKQKFNRYAAQRLIKKHGVEKMLSAAEYALSIQGENYAPQITNILDLEEKLPKLSIYKRKEQNGRAYDIPTA